MDRHVQYDAAVGDRIQRRANGDPRVEIKGLGIAVDDRNDLFPGSSRLFHDLRQFVGQYAHRQTVFFAVIGSECLVGLKDGIEGLLHRFRIRALDDRGDIEIVYRRFFIELLLQIHAALKGGQRIHAGPVLRLDALLAAGLPDQQMLDHARGLS